MTQGLISTEDIVNTRILSEGEDIGRIDDVLFDDVLWKVRFVVLQFDGSSGDRVIIEPYFLDVMDWNRQEKTVPIRMSSAATFNSPRLEETLFQPPENPRPWPFHLNDLGTFGIAGYPAPAEINPGEHFGEAGPRIEAELAGDSLELFHIHRLGDFQHFRVQAFDGCIGNVDGLMIDTQNWKVTEILVDPKTWWNAKPARLKLIDIEKISSGRGEIKIRGRKERIVGAPYIDTQFAL